jgi:sulfur transfer protein SufE
MATSPPQVSLDEIREEVADLETPEERIGYLIELGQTLPDLPVEYQTEIFRVLGCQSMVWVVPEMREQQLYFRGTSDAPMVRGLVAILIIAYSGRSPREILDFPIESLFEELRLKSFMTRWSKESKPSHANRLQHPVRLWKLQWRLESLIAMYRRFRSRPAAKISQSLRNASAAATPWSTWITRPRRSGHRA